MCLNFGTPKNNKFSIWEQMENLLFLGVPKFEHITVYIVLLYGQFVLLAY